MTKQEELCTALLILQLGGTFSNAYGLCRFLSRKFEIFECTEVINGLISHDYVTCISMEGVKQFFMTQKGEEIANENRYKIIEILKNSFPQEKELIETL